MKINLTFALQLHSMSSTYHSSRYLEEFSISACNDQIIETRVIVYEQGLSVP